MWLKNQTILNYIQGIKNRVIIIAMSKINFNKEINEQHNHTRRIKEIRIPN